MSKIPAAQGMPSDATPARHLAGLLLAACYVVIWHLCHMYRGLEHDAHLYALQALARLRPELYAHDIFFRFGSQDSYTVFTSIYAGLIGWVGLDNAAALLTLGSTAVYFCAIWLVARQLAGASIAWLATGLLIVFELYYGGFHVFKTAEEFLTARLPAEAMGLLAVAAWLSRHRAASVGLLAFAFLLHPLMAVPVVGLIALLAVPKSLHRALFVVAAVGFSSAVLIAVIVPVGPMSLVDNDWLSVIRMRSYYLFPTTWPVDSWCRLVVVLSTLTLGTMTRSHAALAQTCGAALAVSIAGVLLTCSTEFWPVKILIQGQAWRWLWIGSVIALMCVPVIAREHWEQQTVGRVTAVLLCASWLMPAESGAINSLLCVLIWSVRTLFSGRSLRLLNMLGIGVVLITLGWLASSLQMVLAGSLDLGREPLIIEKTRDVFGLTAPAVVTVIIVWLLATRAPTRVSLPLRARLLAAVIPLGARPAMEQWAQRPIARSTYMTFADWRAIVPAGTEVLWLWNPVSTWLLLERPNYMSSSQSAGLLFSRELAAEIDRRSRVLEPLGNRKQIILGNSDLDPFKPFTSATLGKICQDRQLGFVVANIEVGPSAGKHEWPRHGQFIWLYDCNSHRAAAANT